MLSNTTTQYLIKLCEKYPENKYVVVEWEELKELWQGDKDELDMQELWKELKINNCVAYKYSDDEEVCFTLTDRARLIIQEYKVLVEESMAQSNASEEEQQELIKDSYIQANEDGSTVVIMPKEVVAEKKKVELDKFRHNALHNGIVGGLIGGGIMGLICGFIGALLARLI